MWCKLRIFNPLTDNRKVVRTTAEGTLADRGHISWPRQASACMDISVVASQFPANLASDVCVFKAVLAVYGLRVMDGGSMSKTNKCLAAPRKWAQSHTLDWPFARTVNERCLWSAAGVKTIKR